MFLTPFIFGECGIRTHAPFPANGFQDHLVMTASITLRVYDNVRKDEIDPIKNIRTRVRIRVFPHASNRK